MKIHLLICEQDTDAVWGGTVKIFLSRKEAQTAMRKDWKDAVATWKYDEHEHRDEDECYCEDDTAIIREDGDVESWRIEEQTLDVRVSVMVKGGLVQNAIANADISMDVCDLDVSDFPDDGEQEAADKKEAKYKELSKTPGWRKIW